MTCCFLPSYQTWGDPSTWTTTRITTAGVIPQGLSKLQLADLQLNSIDVVSAMGGYAGWTDQQVRGAWHVTPYLNVISMVPSHLHNHNVVLANSAKMVCTSESILYIAQTHVTVLGSGGGGGGGGGVGRGTGVLVFRV